MAKIDYSSFIFSHIPKCGGTSFRKLIYESAVASGVESKTIYIPGYNGLKVDRNLIQLSAFQLRSFSKLDLRVTAMHVPYKIHLEYSSLGSNPLYFTLFREPFERFLSHYYFFYYRQGADSCKGIHLSELESKKRTSLIKNLSNIYASYIMGDVKSGLYSDLDLYEETCARLSKQNYCYGLLSDMSSSLDRLAHVLPDWLELKTDFPHINAHNFSATYNDHITDAMSQEFQHHNALDIKIYSYIVNSFSTT